ncbi:hypothetical protein QJQ45_023093 [Haematococcus lacustris]|nr:hypothetical protein QJQ45_023093 [Haematococcus lacustris]
MGLSSKTHPYRRKGGHAARCACCATCTPAGSPGWVEIHVEGEAAFYSSGQSLQAIGHVTAQMSEVIMACSNLKPALIPLAHRTCAQAAAAALAKRLRGQEPASQLQPMPHLSSTPTQAPAPAPAPTIAAPLAVPLAAAGAAPQPHPLSGGAAPPVAEEVESLTAAASPFIDPTGEFEQQAHRLQLQPDVDGSVMLTVRQYGKPSSAVGSRPVELLCMRVSLSDAVGMLNKQMPEYIKHHRLAHHQLQVFREHREAVKVGKDGKVVISCDWSEKLTVERSVEIMSEHWHAAQIGILVACAYFKNKEGAYYEQTVYVMTDGKEQSAAITQAAVNQVVCYLLAEHDMDMRQLYMWSDGCAGQFKGAPAMRQHWGMAQRFSVPVWWSYGATAHFKGRHDSEGGVVKQWLRGEILADRVGKCNALGFVQHCNAYHKAATAADPSKAHRARASVGHRWCLELSTQEKRDDKHWDDECLTLLCSFAPDSVMQLCTLGKKLSVKMLNEYCKAVGLCVPVGTLRADLRYMVLQHLNEQAECD